LRITSKRNRKAISPVLATVILIAITLIAAIAIAGFVFGLFGSFTSSAQVAAHVTDCNNTNGTCTLILTNTGTSNVVVNACSINNAGAAEAGTLGAVKAAPAGASTGNVHCTIATHTATTGSEAVGSLAMSNGATVPFTGVWNPT